MDDEEDFRGILAKRLGKRGLHVRQAQDGEDALAAMAHRPSEVVVLDVKMPGMNGIEVLERLKRDHPETEVILLTGHASTEDGVQGMKAGAFDYLSKPVEIEHLAGKIRQAWAVIENSRKEVLDREFRERMETRLAQAQRLAALGTLAAGVAHEINNPLAVINDSAGWLRQIMDKEDLPDGLREKFAKGLEMIGKSVGRARRITHQLLGSARGPAERMEEVELSEMAGDAVELVSKDASGQDVSIEIEAGRAGLLSDPCQLRQVFINLLTNAVHASPRGGRVKVGIVDREREVILTVADSGAGIPEKDRARVFEPFFSTKKSDEGTGLGLFVSGSIVRRLGGRIEVSGGEGGKGTVFSVILPKEPPESAATDRGEGTCRVDWKQEMQDYVADS